MVLACVALSSFVLTHSDDDPAVQVVYEPIIQTAPVMTHAERSNRIRSAILSLAERHRVTGDRERLNLLADTIYRESLQNDIDPLLVAAIISMESSFRPAVVSEAGAVGLMQLRPFVAQDLAQRSALEWNGVETRHAPQLNVRLGILYYKELLHRFEGDPEIALTADLFGPTRVRRQIARGTYRGSSYADDILDLYSALSTRRAGA